MADDIKIKRAIVSVSDKSGVEEFARALHEFGIEILSTGGTMKKLKEAGVPAISISTFTGAPEIMGGRVKTLHPKVHAGILFRRDNPKDLEQLSEQDYRPIDMVVVNLYPFKQTVAKPTVTEKEAIENIDIGGPTMIRAAAKNFDGVTVVVDPADYDRIINELREHNGTVSREFRRECARKAFALTADYDNAIAKFFVGGSTVETKETFPVVHRPAFQRKAELRYGENPHQSAALYALDGYAGPTLVDGEILAGKELSFNNYGDLDACLDMILDFKEPFACVVKHANPCGAAIDSTIAGAYKKAYESDPLSAFGCIIGLNRPVDIACAGELHETPFVECIIAPGFDDDALHLLQKKKARRLMALPSVTSGLPKNDLVSKFIRGGLLLQTADTQAIAESDLKTVTKRLPTHEEIKELLFAMKVVKHTKSNAIVLSRDGATVGIGMGQTSRVDSSFLAVKRSGGRAKGAVMASDAFFPMPDGLEVAAEAGVTAVIQPGGSKGDEAVIEAANKYNIAMVFTGIRHFKH